MKSLDDRRRRYRREFNRVRTDFSEESVHDLRVAMRRLLALLALIHSLLPEADLKPVRRELKGRLDSLDHLRDAQVMLAEVGPRVLEYPGLAPFEQALKQRVEEQLVLVRNSLGRITFAVAGNLQGRLLGLRENLAGQRQLGDPLVVADRAYGDVLTRYGMVDAADPASFHRLRVPFKKFRYTLEIVQPLVPGLEKGSLVALSDYQTLLGTVQDANVLLGALDLPPSETGAPPDNVILEYYRTRLATSISEAQLKLGDVKTFWRASPEEPFPWEMPS